MESLLVIKGWLAVHVPAVIGSGISLLANKEKTKNMSRIELYGVFLTGIVLSHYFGSYAIETYNINYNSITADTIKITIAVFGWGLLTAVLDQIPIILDAIRKKWLGN